LCKYSAKERGFGIADQGGKVNKENSAVQLGAFHKHLEETMEKDCRGALGGPGFQKTQKKKPPEVVLVDTVVVDANARGGDSEEFAGDGKKKGKK